MATIQKTEYKKLEYEREKNTNAFKIMVTKKLKKPIQENRLFSLAKLNIKGGPKDISSKMDSYFYNN